MVFEGFLYIKQKEPGICFPLKLPGAQPWAAAMFSLHHYTNNSILAKAAPLAVAVGDRQEARPPGPP